MSAYDDITADNDSTLAAARDARPTVNATHAAGAVAMALVLGLGSGYAAAGRPVVQSPQACHEMAATAEALDVVQAELLVAVRDRGDALGMTDYRVLDAEVNHLLASMAPAETAYVTAKGECLGSHR